MIDTHRTINGGADLVKKHFSIRLAAGLAVSLAVVLASAGIGGRSNVARSSAFAQIAPALPAMTPTVGPTPISTPTLMPTTSPSSSPSPSASVSPIPSANPSYAPGLGLRQPLEQRRY
ncbi:MAG TPA: hypothetical protein VII69_00095 [Candidatus Eremiobacteraceae bacterium]